MAWATTSIPALGGRTAVVTGANSGLGFQTARQLAAHSAHVVLATRDRGKTLAAMQRIRAETPTASLEMVTMDLAEQASIWRAAEQIRTAHPRIDLLVNNAGVMAVSQATTVDGFERQLAVNHLGHWTLTALLLTALLRTSDSRVVTVTSTAHHIGKPIDPENPHLHGRYTPWRAYCQAKLANYHFGLGLDRALRKAEAHTASLIAHPGVARTGLQAASLRDSNGGRSQRLIAMLARHTGASAQAGALPQLRAATDPAAYGGQFYGPLLVNSGPPVPKPILRRFDLDDAISQLWSVSRRETGISIDIPPRPNAMPY
ncbi:oxidoreductase [Nocardia gamkensis]|uniref:oxidoreductase n=1 Tax=Nocardia gamkensis TaxID=352869 RepID=UPI0033C8ED06